MVEIPITKNKRHLVIKRSLRTHRSLRKVKEVKKGEIWRLGCPHQGVISTVVAECDL